MKCAFLEGNYNPAEIEGIISRLNTSFNETRAILAFRMGSTYTIDKPPQLKGEYTRNTLESLIERHGINWCAVYDTATCEYIRL